MLSKTHYKLYLVFILVILSSCSSDKTSQYQRFTISTSYGNIQGILYNDIPLYKDNFIKLVKLHFYDGLLFHRVIPSFVIQGGDPSSIKSPAGSTLGNGGPGYTLPAQISPLHFHKRGAIAAAREPDISNPERRSNGSQFYIVLGKKYTDEELNAIQNQIRENQYQNIYIQNFLSIKKRFEDQHIALNMDLISLTATDSAQKQYSRIMPFEFTTEQKQAYTTIGGAPHLDGSYTVFGEITEGMDIAEKIASQPTDSQNRPLKNIAMKITVHN